jgi:hypothetical protein
MIFMNSRKLHRLTTRCLALLILCLSSAFSNAQNEGRWYQVEVLIFKRNPLQVNTDEIWRNDLDLSYPPTTRDIPNKLSKDNHELGGHDYTLRRNEGFTVLFHEAWRQQMWEKEKSPSLLVRGGQRFGDRRELEGTIRIHIGRYLHVSTDLWLSEFDYTSNTQSPSSTSEATRLKLPPLPNQNNAQAYQYLFDEGPKLSRIVPLREKRRMRSKETHYIDHPVMGMLVRMLPVK